jgi:hypothetical protein
MSTLSLKFKVECLIIEIYGGFLMIDLSSSVMWVNIGFIVIALIIFLIFYLKGLMSSLYDFIAFGIIVVVISPLSTWFSNQVPLFSNAQISEGLFGVIATRFVNQAVWGIILYTVLSLFFLFIKRPTLKHFPLKLDKKMDKALSFLISGVLVFLIGTLITGALLSPVFANGETIVDETILVVFKSSGQSVVDSVGEQFEDYSIVGKLMDGQQLTLEDQSSIVDLFVSFEIPVEVATTLSKFALEQEVTNEELNELLSYAQEQGLTLEDLRKLLTDLGLSQELIDELLDVMP